MFVLTGERERDGMRPLVSYHDDDGAAEAAAIAARAASWRDVQILRAGSQEAWRVVVSAALFDVFPVDVAAEMRTALKFNALVMRISALAELRGVDALQVLHDLGDYRAWYLPRTRTAAMVAMSKIDLLVRDLDPRALPAMVTATVDDESREDSSVD